MIASSEVNFLGYHLSTQGIKPQEQLVEAIPKFSRPTTKKQLKGFLGTVSFYRNFIDRCADITRPLRNPTKEATLFNWDDDCESAFRHLKTVLSEIPILAFPNNNNDFIVEVDASKDAVGGVLLQEQGSGVAKPTTYYSFALSEQRQKWDTPSKEIYALVVALRHWHVYLFGNKFVLKSDRSEQKGSSRKARTLADGN